ncbi:hypothetical protein EDB81DRAFT_813206 [Dactylonectria macrodidyma]|uniref:Uncharacterized protein n=1 Tax=Dactylonectria macrodidyma TaxID=307937 RepID=A0A9P9DPX6_9HYPO|nr:hypothetical protein EDB81DRAFT_813206 [Dactylonectria macrodidyma]
MYATPRMLPLLLSPQALSLPGYGNLDGHRPMTGYVNPPGRSTKAARACLGWEEETNNDRPHIASFLLSSRGLRNGPDHWSRSGNGRTKTKARPPVLKGEERRVRISHRETWVLSHGTELRRRARQK